MIEEAFREHWARVVAALVRTTGDLDRAQDAAQDAFAIAADRWPRDGTPESPLGWLVTTARNRAIDRIRRERTGAAKLRRLDATVEQEPPRATLCGEIEDERLELVLMCCHPSLARDAQVALTLRAVAGVPSEDIAAAFLVAPETMKRRLTRARAKLQREGVPFARPEPDELHERLGSALAVVYLVFNMGYMPQAGHDDLADEAIHLARMLTALVPGEAEPRALLGLMLCHHSRRDARLDATSGALVPLTEQDGARWDRAMLAEGRAAVDQAVALGGRGRYVLEAAIAVLQTERPIDWPQVVALYDQLVAMTGSPVVALSRAVAVAEAGDPAAALAAADALELDGYRYFQSTRAELLRRLGDHAAAAEAYDKAIAQARSEPERRLLIRRRAEL